MGQEKEAKMRVTTRTDESEVTSDVIVQGPKVILYDHLERPLKRPIGFTAPERRLDNRPQGRVNSPSTKTRNRS